MIQALHRLLYNYFLKHHLDLQMVCQLRRLIYLPLENYNLIYKYSFRICICVSCAVFTRTSPLMWCFLSSKHVYVCLSLTTAHCTNLMFPFHTQYMSCFLPNYRGVWSISTEYSARLLLWTIFSNKQKINLPHPELFTCALKCNLAIMDWNWGCSLIHELNIFLPAALHS
jgi:hypothetical protein